GVPAAALDAVWRAAEDLYRTALYPAVQLCIRHRGAVVLDRALGHARGNAPGDWGRVEAERATPETPIRLYSASKPVTAMLVHKLDERGLLHLGDRVCEYLPEFRTPDKEGITLSHVLAHRAGFPTPPPEALDFEAMARPEHLISILAERPALSRPGRRLAYHAVTGGFVLGEVVRRVTGTPLREVLAREIRTPLGLAGLDYGVPPEDVPRVAQDAVTGLPVFPPVSNLLQRALGASHEEVVSLAQEPGFLAHPIPAGNVVATAREVCTFYQCLLNGGAHDGAQVFAPRTVRRATVEQSAWEADLTLVLPLRYGLGFMLGGSALSLYGPRNPHAFGHLGFTNIFSWADPERELSVALLTTGKPVINLEELKIFSLLFEIAKAFPRDTRRSWAADGNDAD
ncbi:MAG: beta-lactamase family protein, partial [Proteobacteria bacterium]|nr:beta-lactamase family protein [Pseudomonadota bacterium]